MDHVCGVNIAMLTGVPMPANAKVKPEKRKRIRPVPAVTRAVAILRLLGRSPHPLGVKAIAESLGMVTSTCLHIVRVLVDEGLLRFDDNTKRYSLGPGLLSLARNALQGNSFTSMAQPALNRIASKWGVTTMAAEMSDLDHMIVVALSTSQAPFRLHVDVGSRFPALISATGRLAAAFAEPPPNRIEKQFRLLKWASPPDYDQWLAEVELARSRKYGVDSGNYISGITLIAAPVFDTRSRMTHSLTAAGLADTMDQTRLKAIAKDLLQEAEQLTRLSTS
jgi:DNA-binding IclR family transcriptional regulator